LERRGSFRVEHRRAHLRAEALKLLEPLLDLGGTYGDPNAGDPIQYNALRIEHDQGDVEIIASRRGGRPPSRNPEESGHAG